MREVRRFPTISGAPPDVRIGDFVYQRLKAVLGLGTWQFFFTPALVDDKSRFHSMIGPRVESHVYDSQLLLWPLHRDPRDLKVGATDQARDS